MSTTSTTATVTQSRRPRAVCFQHLRTGRIITAPSIAAFARRARLGPNGQYHYDDVLKGKRLHNGGWGLPERLNQRVAVKDVWGNSWEGSVEDLRCRVSATAANRLARGLPIGNLLPADVPVPAGTGKRPLYATHYALRKGSRIYRDTTLRGVGKQVGLSLFTVWMLVHKRVAKTRCGVRLHAVRWARRTALGAKACSI